MQNGIECYCGNAPVRKHGEAKTCDVPCPEDNELPCGGATSNSIYSVSTGIVEAIIINISHILFYITAVLMTLCMELGNTLKASLP